MAREKRSFFDKLLNSFRSYKSTSFSRYGRGDPIFSIIDPSGNIYNNDAIRICIDVIASHCAKMLPKHFQDTNGNHTNIKGEINFLLGNMPNPIMTPYDFIYKIVTMYYVKNNVFVLKDLDKNGMIIGFYPINYYYSEFLKDSDNNLYVKFDCINGTQYTLAYQDLIHLRRFYSDSDFVGSNNEPLISSIQTLVTAEEGIGTAIKTSNSLRGIIKYNQNLKQKDIEKNRQQFVDDFLNSKGQGIAAIDNKGEFVELNMKPITLDKDQLDHVSQRVLNYFRLNKNIISSDFTPEQWNAFYESVLEPLAIYFGQAFTNNIFTKKAIKEGHKIEFTVNRIQYASMDTKIKVVKEAGSLGVLTVDQALSILELPEIGGEEGAKRIQSLNYINSAIADLYQLGKIKDKGGDDDEK